MNETRAIVIVNTNLANQKSLALMLKVSVLPGVAAVSKALLRLVDPVMVLASPEKEVPAFCAAVSADRAKLPSPSALMIFPGVVLSPPSATGPVPEVIRDNVGVTLLLAFRWSVVEPSGNVARAEPESTLSLDVK